MILRAWNRFWFAPGPAWALGTCRLLFFGMLAFWQLPHDFAPWGSYSSVFWMPIWLFDTLGVPAFPPQAIGWIQMVWKASLILAAIGLFTRPAMTVAFVLGTYLMGLPHNFGQTQHFDTLVVFASGALALSRAGDACSIDALVRAARRRSPDRPAESGEYTWPIRFVWVAMALIFCAAGLSKLRHSGLGWIFSDNLSLLLLRQQYHISDGDPLTSWGILVAHHQWMAHAMAAASITIETMFPLVLFSRRARAVLVPAGLLFLIGIRMLMGPTFEQFMMCYVFWVPWPRAAAAVRARVAGRPPYLVLYDGGCGFCTRSITTLMRVDILDRLRFADVATDWPWLGGHYPSLERSACLSEMHVAGPDGRVYAGFDAWRTIARLVPLGWTALPFLLIPGVPAAGRRAYRVIASHRTTTTCRLDVAPRT
jgi:predicted DCC family thiol-disulfide oxidoreductase YuxK